MMDKDDEEIVLNNYDIRTAKRNLYELFAFNNPIDELIKKIAFILDEQITEISGKTARERSTSIAYGSLKVYEMPNNCMAYYWEFGDKKYHLIDIKPLVWPQVGWGITEYKYINVDNKAKDGN
jgi:hypothetical protein